MSTLQVEPGAEELGSDNEQPDLSEQAPPNEKEVAQLCVRPNCDVFTFDPISCPHCPLALYCSKECRKLDLAVHEVECREFNKNHDLQIILHAYFESPNSPIVSTLLCERAQHTTDERAVWEINRSQPLGPQFLVPHLKWVTEDVAEEETLEALAPLTREDVAIIDVCVWNGTQSGLCVTHTCPRNLQAPSYIQADLISVRNGVTGEVPRTKEDRRLAVHEIHAFMNSICMPIQVDIPLRRLVADQVEEFIEQGVPLAFPLRGLQALAQEEGKTSQKDKGKGKNAEAEPKARHVLKIYFFSTPKDAERARASTH